MNNLKKIVRGRMIESGFILESGIINSFMEFLNKFKIEIPSKDKARKTLERYSIKDIEDAYESLPRILKMFKIKKADEGFFSPFQNKLIKNAMILICLISIASGVLPKNPAAAEEKMKMEKVFYKNFDYVGKISLDDIKKVVNKEDTFETALKKN